MPYLKAFKNVPVGNRPTLEIQTDELHRLLAESRKAVSVHESPTLPCMPAVYYPRKGSK